MDNTPTTDTSTNPAALGLLAGKVAFITGAGRGIGAAAARLFAREGARVLLAARTEAQLKAVTEEVRAAGGIADHVVCDLADAASVRAAVDRAVDRYGRLDVAFNNGATIVRPARWTRCGRRRPRTARLAYWRPGLPPRGVRRAGRPIHAGR